MPIMCACARTSAECKFHQHSTSGGKCIVQIGQFGKRSAVCKGCRLQVYDFGKVRTCLAHLPTEFTGLKLWGTQLFCPGSDTGVASEFVAHSVKLNAPAHASSLCPSTASISESTPASALSDALAPEAVSSAFQYLPSNKRPLDDQTNFPHWAVHHFWVELRSAASPWDAFLTDPVHIACLKSWQPMPQALWSYSVVAGKDCPLPGAANCVGLKLRDASELMPCGEALSMLAAGIPIQYVKDIFSMRVLAKYGGVWGDLDMFCLKPPGLNASDAIVVVAEPHSRPSTWTRGRSATRFTLALFGAPPACTVFGSLDSKWSRKWWKRTVDIMNGKKERPEQDGNGWMANTDDFTAAVFDLIAAAFPVRIMHPWQACPYPINFKPKDMLEVLQGCVPGSGEVELSDARPMAPLNYTLTYEAPSMLELKQYASMINLWHRQWAPEENSKWTVDLLDRMLHALGLIRSSHITEKVTTVSPASVLVPCLHAF